MSPVPRTPPPEPSPDSSDGFHSLPHTTPRRGLTPAIAYGLDDEDDVKLTSLSGHEILEKHYQMPQMPTWPSPFDSPTSDRMSSSASKYPWFQENIVKSVRMTEHPPDWRLSAWGTPSRSSSGREGRAQQSYSGGTFVGYGNNPKRIRYHEHDPVRRFLAAELHRMADSPPSQNNATNTESPTIPQSPNQAPKSRKRGATAVENQDKDLDAAIRENGDEDWMDTKLVPGMAELELSRKSPTPRGRPSKRAKYTEADSDYEGITDCPQTSY